MSRWDAFRERFSSVARATSVLRKTSEALTEAASSFEAADDEEGRAAAEAIRTATAALEAAQRRLQVALAAKRLTPANREAHGLEAHHD